MIYGMYLSAAGVMASVHRQDVIANNLANSETVGFKRHVANFQQRLTEAQIQRNPDETNGLLDEIGGGLFLSPTQVDTSQGELEQTGNNLDAAIFGSGYYMVDDHGTPRLTRDGRFMLNSNGEMILANGTGQRVLDPKGNPIRLSGEIADHLQVGRWGEITSFGNPEPLARLGVFDVADPTQLVKQGQNLFSYPELDPKNLSLSRAELRNGFVERANVDPATELTTLMETQRQLEANANMIKYQDGALGKCVNEVGRIG
jgi:flagellar basal body rod protein FlgG